MYKVSQQNRVVSKIPKITFSQLGLKERNDLQEWIVNNPTILGEELLIIQKEFAGFNDTNERLDLLALDKTMNLVIIENKLDDSGREVTWQASKYASYCANLTTDEIKKMYQDYLNKYEAGAKAEERLSEFYEDVDVEELELNKKQSERIILVAGNFRREVTSTVLWMREYGINIQCIKIIPYQLGQELLIDIEQIIPVKEVEEYTVKLQKKNHSDLEISRKNVKAQQERKMFWQSLLDYLENDGRLHINNSPTDDDWLTFGAGVSGVRYTFKATQKYASVQLTIDKPEAARNKAIYDLIIEDKEKIEEAFGQPLEWKRLSEKRVSRIIYRKDGVNWLNQGQNEEINKFLTDYMIRLQAVMDTYINKVKNNKM